MLSLDTWIQAQVISIKYVNKGLTIMPNSTEYKFIIFNNMLKGSAIIATRCIPVKSAIISK